VREGREIKKRWKEKAQRYRERVTEKKIKRAER
jgi:hypothetical protein